MVRFGQVGVSPLLYPSIVRLPHNLRFFFAPVWDTKSDIKLTPKIMTITTTTTGAASILYSTYLLLLFFFSFTMHN